MYDVISTPTDTYYSYLLSYIYLIKENTMFITILVFKYIETTRFLIQITFKIFILYIHFINILKMYILFVNILKYVCFISKVMSVSFLATVDNRLANG